MSTGVRSASLAAAVLSEAGLASLKKGECGTALSSASSFSSPTPTLSESGAGSSAEGEPAAGADAEPVLRNSLPGGSHSENAPLSGAVMVGNFELIQNSNQERILIKKCWLTNIWLTNIF